MEEGPVMQQMPHRVAVAFSGGRDSTALLHATARMAHELGGVEVVALHVNHGLSRFADAWELHAQDLVHAWRTQWGWPVKALSRRLNWQPQPGESLEAGARRARYAALAEMADEAGAEMVLLGHHRRDQAETVLLQALRGGGLAGLAAMPGVAERAGILWVRPWLGHSREAIEAYVVQHALPCVEDDSNVDARFARNRLRAQVWPALTGAFPDAEHALADAAKRLAAQLAPTQAWLDAMLAAVRLRDGALDVAVFARLPQGLGQEVLTAWYRACCGLPLSVSWARRLAQEVPAAHVRQRPARWPELRLTLYRGELCWRGGHAHARSEDLAPSVAQAAAPGSVAWSIDAPGTFSVPDWPGGVLTVREVATGGVEPTCLLALTVRARMGGEQFQAGPGRPPRALKKQFQAAGCPPWLRGGPLLFAGDALLFVPGLGLDARMLAPGGARQWGLSWELKST
jgi:tRNA(Ile)-lysidine synthase